MTKIPFSFQWPEALVLLLLLPLLVALYVWLGRRRKKLALRYASLSIVKEAMGRGAGWRRHVPPLLFLGALALMLVAVARPTAVITLPSQEKTVVLAMDVSAACAPRTSSRTAWSPRRMRPSSSLPSSRCSPRSASCPSPARPRW
jgi:Ca-activated chloride channel family protein